MEEHIFFAAEALHLYHDAIMIASIDVMMLMAHTNESDNDDDDDDEIHFIQKI